MSILFNIINLIGLNIIIVCQFVWAYIKKTTVTIGKDTFFIYKQRESLDLSNKNICNEDIKKISRLIFLKELNLASNNISDISDLKNLYLIESLNLSGNSIREIGVLEHLNRRNLMHLILDNNRIIDITSLSGLPVKRLSLARNQISNIESINTLVNVEYINISGNRLRTINLNNLIFLKELRLSNNEISCIKVSNLEQLMTLNLDSNIIEKFDISGINQIISLSIVNNKMKNLDLILPFRNLSFLDLADNNIENIEAITDFQNLNILNLSNNSIINGYPVIELENLKELDLSGNKIDRIWRFLSLPKDCNIKLNNIHLGKEKSSFFQTLTRKRSLCFICRKIASIEELFFNICESKYDIRFYRIDLACKIDENQNLIKDEYNFLYLKRICCLYYFGPHPHYSQGERISPLDLTLLLHDFDAFYAQYFDNYFNSNRTVKLLVENSSEEVVNSEEGFGFDFTIRIEIEPFVEPFVESFTEYYFHYVKTDDIEYTY